MKANQRTKKSITLESIYKTIECLPHDSFKHFIPHFVYVSDEVKSELLRDGYKLYYGDWDGITTNALIIEW